MSKMKEILLTIFILAVMFGACITLIAVFEYVWPGFCRGAVR